MRVEPHKRVKRYLKRMNNPFKQEIKDALKGLAHEPPEGDIEPIKGIKDTYRLRTGGYRIIYEDLQTYLHVTHITPRGDAYKGGRHG
jgi:mRNA-degrading endonuclease RelE of RelBE toxin-antitoxin system